MDFKTEYDMDCTTEKLTVRKLTANDFNRMIQVYKVRDGVEVGKISDGYHTFDELYHHRAILTASLFNMATITGMKCWKSKQHHDGSMYDGMFIVGIETLEGPATYHYDIDPYWDLFIADEIDKAPEWDGHSPEEAIGRIMMQFCLTQALKEKLKNNDLFE